jgi:hypothetical protein
MTRSRPQRRRLLLPTAFGRLVPMSSRLVLLFPLLFSLEASTSERHREVPLARVVAASRLIVLAHPATPPFRTVSVDITPKGKSPGDKAPPFEYRVQRWVVEELLTPSDAMKPGDTLEVSPADWEYRLTVHRKYHLEGVNKIGLYEVYRASPPPEGEPRRLLFLEPEGKAWRFTYAGAVEAPSRRAEVLKLLSMP